MKIGLDCFVFRFPGAGIVNYTWQFVRNMIREFPRHEYSLFVQDETFSDPAMASLKNNADFIAINIYQPTLISRLRKKLFLTRRNRGRFIDTFPSLKHNLKNYPENIDLYHGIDWFFYPPLKSQKNILTIFDLTTELFPQFHERLNIEKDLRKAKMARQYDQIITISQATSNDIAERSNIDIKKVHTV